MSSQESGRGKPPTKNKRHSKKRRKEELIDAAMDVYRVERLQESVHKQLERFEEMAQGGDGGKLRPHHTETIREQHYPKWTDRDFKDLVKQLNEAIKNFKEQEESSDDAK